MFVALIFWLSTAALTVLWAVTGGEWFGFGVCVLLAARLALFVFIILDLLLDNLQRVVQRSLYRKPPLSVQLGDYALDFVALCVFGWLAQGGARYGMAAVLLYVANLLLWEVLHAMLQPRGAR